MCSSLPTDTDKHNGGDVQFSVLPYDAFDALTWAWGVGCLNLQLSGLQSHDFPA